MLQAETENIACGTVNDERARGSGYRIYSDPAWPPRNDGSKYAEIAQNHDFMTSRVTRAMIHAHLEHGVHIAAENLRGDGETVVYECTSLEGSHRETDSGLLRV